MSEKDYYKTLGVSSDASQEEIRKAYRRLAKKYHPDRNRGSKAAEQRFKEITEAHQVLSDPKKRKQYDRLREAGMQGGFEGFEDIFAGFGQAGKKGGGGFGYEDMGSGFGDLFSRMFGGDASGGTAYATAQRGRDIRTSVTVPFDLSVSGGKIQVTVPRQQTCKRCGGTGAAPGTQAHICPQCGGSGRVQSGLGGFSVSRPCPQCFGRGRILRNVCSVCRGSGISEASSRIEVKIPKGIENGQKLRLAGMGQPGTGAAPAGDLILEVHVGKHPRFERKGKDIYSRAKIDMVQAALGTEVDVPALKGTITVKVPAGTQPGQKLRLKGHGIRGDDGKAGDHYVEVVVTIPRKLSERQKELLKEFGRAHAGSKK